MRALFLFLTLCFVSPVFAEETKYIIFFGDSLTAGLGVSPDEAYPALIQQRLPSPYQIQNSGVSGDTTSDGLRRLNWALHNEPAIFILALGANDGLRGLDPAFIEKNLRDIIAHVRERFPKAKIVLAGMELPTNLGTSYREQFQEIFPKIANELHLPLIPFLLEGVAGHPTLNQPDGIHPTAEGHKIVADNVWKILKPLL